MISQNRFRFLILLIGLGILVGQLKAENIPEKALCTVCVVLSSHDKNEPEKVRAWSVFEEKQYYFCSEGCQEKFDGDPMAWVPPVFPRPVPAASFRNLTGEATNIADFAGNVTLVDFWATWCAPCIKMMPELKKLQQKYADQGFTVVGISIDAGEDIEKKVSKFVSKKKISYPVMLDVNENPAWAAFHVPAIPATYLVDQQGQIVAQWIGRFDHKSADEKIADLLNANN